MRRLKISGHTASYSEGKKGIRSCCEFLISRQISSVRKEGREGGRKKMKEKDNKENRKKDQRGQIKASRKIYPLKSIEGNINYQSSNFICNYSVHNYIYIYIYIYIYV